MIRALVLAMLIPGPAYALELAFSQPLNGQDGTRDALASYALPVGPWAGGTLPVQVFEGAVERRALRLDAGGASLLEILAPLRDQITAAGYTLRLDCDARACGGFDFRFATEILPEPIMHVDLGEYRFLSASRDGAAISLLVSRSETEVFVQVIQVSGAGAAAPDAGSPAVDREAPPDPPATPGTLAARLDAGLAAPLDDLVFAPGQAALSEGDYASLAALADWLKADPARRLALVGHTDVSGALAANIALSRARAEAARAVLVSRYGIAGGQVTAEGIGPLSPRAPNDTEAGRQKNRRVEAVATSTPGVP